MSNPSQSHEMNIAWNTFLHENAEDLILDYISSVYKKKIKISFITYLKEEFNTYLNEQ
jgi:FAD synthase